MTNSSVAGPPPVIQWRDYYSVGDRDLDDQHKQIIFMINWLYEIIWHEGGERAAVSTVVRRLSEYTRTHFVDEEKKMLAAGFPGLAEHQRIHEKLRNDTSDLLFKSFGGEGLDPRETLCFLKQWWVGHITGDDKEYMFYLKNNPPESVDLPNVDGELNVLMTALLENEQRIGRYYQLMAECLPEHRETWDILQRQEAAHAEAMQRVCQRVEETPALFAVGKFSPKAARVMSHEIDSMIEKIEQGKVHPGYAVSFAKDVEQSLLESRLDEAIKTDVLEVRNILAKLTQETVSHRLLLHGIQV